MLTGEEALQHIFLGNPPLAYTPQGHYPPRTVGGSLAITIPYRVPLLVITVMVTPHAGIRGLCF